MLRRLMFTVASVVCCSPAFANTGDDAGNRSYSAIEQAVQSWRSSADKDCAAPLMKQADDVASHMADTYSQLSASLSNPALGETHRSMNADNAQGLAPWAVRGLITMADTWLAGGCLDNAKADYNSVLEAFPDAAFQGIRDRANNGLADIRAKAK